MIYYPIQALVDSGITEIMIVTGGEFAGDFLKLLRNGQEFGLKGLSYAYQDGEGGIADALSLAEHFVSGDDMCVILGDNIFEYSIKPVVDAYRAQEKGAKVLLREVDDATRFGVAEVQDGNVINIEEKPKEPKSNLAVTGVYFYDSHVFEIISGIEPSARGELEITDVNNSYISRGELTCDVVKGWWTDAGTFGSLVRATNLVAESGANKPQ
jgi:glucose-1-phosphate thymidylyltransferase